MSSNEKFTFKICSDINKTNNNSSDGGEQYGKGLYISGYISSDTDNTRKRAQSSTV